MHRPTNHFARLNLAFPVRLHIRFVDIDFYIGSLTELNQKMAQPAWLGRPHLHGNPVFATGSTITRHRKEQALELARDVIAAHPFAAPSGATSPNPPVVLVRVLAPAVEPAMQLLRAVRRAWRVGLWEMEGNEPRIWAM